MNLLLLEAGEVDAQGVARLGGRRLVHANEVLRAQASDKLRVGMRDGNVGDGEVLSIDARELVLRVALAQPPPARPGVDLLLGMPRPKVLKRVLPALASLGVDRIVLVNAATVEKSYFATPLLAPESVAELFSLGLEQSRDTVAPTLFVEPLFRPFVEDRLDVLFPAPSLRLLAHPASDAPLREFLTGRSEIGRTLLAVGPEGGWVPFELELLAARGFTRISLGARPLRTEVALPALVGALLATR
jgi:RsmE family RNA methyltransferase